MTIGGTADVLAVIERAQDVYADDPRVREQLDVCASRLRDPLRIGIAGMVKAGKSTLLNALIGEEIAPTDAGECTRMVTWYRHGRTARVTAHLADGTREELPVRRVDGRLDLDVGDLTADEVDRIDVEWPSESLRSTVLIDTPGIASLSADVSARTTRFLTPSEGPSAADAIIYLLRHVHASDVKFLEEFHDSAAGASETVNAVAVLSRADEIGSGRIDSLLSAAKVAERYRRDGELRALALDVIPVAGLLAEGARTLRESEFAAFRSLAALGRAERERMLISVDRFTRDDAPVPLPVRERAALLSRFGVCGVRLATTVVRSGVRTSSDLAERLLEHSGLPDVQRFIGEQFRARALDLKLRGVIQALDALIRARPRTGSADLLGDLEHSAASTHGLRELALLARLRTGEDGGLDRSSRSEAERILGGAGVASWSRLALDESASGAEIAARAEERLGWWRALANSPLTDRPTSVICRTVVRTLEGLVSQVPTDVDAGAAAADVDAAR